MTTARAATTIAQILASDFENGDTIDGVVLATNDIVLIKNQSTGSENGVYRVNASGAPTRVQNWRSGVSAAQNTIYITEGTSGQYSTWICTNASGSDVVATDALTFSKIMTRNQETLSGVSTMTNKTFTSPAITNATLSLDDTASANELSIVSTSSPALTADRTITIDANDAVLTVDLSGNLTLADAFTTSGANSLTLTTTGNTSLTLPTSGTLGSLAGTEALTNKTITATTNSVRGTELATTGSSVVISTASAPITGQVLTTTSATTANWQTPGGERYINVGGEESVIAQATYTVAYHFAYPGSTAAGTITSVNVIANVNTGTYNVRLQDITNALTIAEITGQSNTTKALVNLGTVSNVPTGEAHFEFQTFGSGGNPSLFYGQLTL